MELMKIPAQEGIVSEEKLKWIVRSHGEFLLGSSVILRIFLFLH